MKSLRTAPAIPDFVKDPVRLNDILQLLHAQISGQLLEWMNDQQKIERLRQAVKTTYYAVSVLNFLQDVVPSYPGIAAALITNAVATINQVYATLGNGLEVLVRLRPDERGGRVDNSLVEPQYQVGDAVIMGALGNEFPFQLLPHNLAHTCRFAATAHGVIQRLFAEQRQVVLLFLLGQVKPPGVRIALRGAIVYIFAPQYLLALQVAPYRPPVADFYADAVALHFLLADLAPRGRTSIPNAGVVRAYVDNFLAQWNRDSPRGPQRSLFLASLLSYCNFLVLEARIDDFARRYAPGMPHTATMQATGTFVFADPAYHARVQATLPFLKDFRLPNAPLINQVFVQPYVAAVLKVPSAAAAILAADTDAIQALNDRKIFLHHQLREVFSQQFAFNRLVCHSVLTDRTITLDQLRDLRPPGTQLYLVQVMRCDLFSQCFKVYGGPHVSISHFGDHLSELSRFVSGMIHHSAMQQICTSFTAHISSNYIIVDISDRLRARIVVQLQNSQINVSFRRNCGIIFDVTELVRNIVHSRGMLEDITKESVQCIAELCPLITNYMSFIDLFQIPFMHKFQFRQHDSAIIFTYNNYIHILITTKDVIMRVHLKPHTFDFQISLDGDSLQAKIKDVLGKNMSAIMAQYQLRHIVDLTNKTVKIDGKNVRYYNNFGLINLLNQMYSDNMIAEKRKEAQLAAGVALHVAQCHEYVNVALIDSCRKNLFVDQTFRISSGYNEQSFITFLITTLDGFFSADLRDTVDLEVRLSDKLFIFQLQGIDPKYMTRYISYDKSCGISLVYDAQTLGLVPEPPHFKPSFKVRVGTLPHLKENRDTREIYLNSFVNSRVVSFLLSHRIASFETQYRINKMSEDPMPLACQLVQLRQIINYVNINKREFGLHEQHSIEDYENTEYVGGSSDTCVGILNGPMWFGSGMVIQRMPNTRRWVVTRK